MSEAHTTREQRQGEMAAGSSGNQGQGAGSARASDKGGENTSEGLFAVPGACARAGAYL